MNYQGQTLAVMNGVELVVALYDGMVRFLYRAIANVEAGDIAGRRESIRRVLEILTYLQARLRTDIGREPAAALSEFYATIYAQCVRASRDASIPLLRQSVRNVLQVRDAWKQAALTDFRGDAPSRTRDAMNSASWDSRVMGSSASETESGLNRWSA